MRRFSSGLCCSSWRRLFRGFMSIQTLKEREKEHLAEVLGKTHWDLGKCARLLRIPLSQVKRKITEYGLKKPGPSGPESKTEPTNKEGEE